MAGNFGGPLAGDCSEKQMPPGVSRGGSSATSSYSCANSSMQPGAAGAVLLADGDVEAGASFEHALISAATNNTARIFNLPASSRIGSRGSHLPALHKIALPVRGPGT